ncbi:hypothetical protein PFISCL1PPCAC_4348 [Pristionchus fissidentatus]|uniref:Uncharacterized protein n=1 Tax=Pristionchus fissidentatus TaxID=1538716 RepID=A0AAV5V0G9_9BILA|nr:hypothetical protein PFISCL1PPCAC_4348 [Pristionchus fissidentatus]
METAKSLKYLLSASTSQIPVALFLIIVGILAKMQPKNRGCIDIFFKTSMACKFALPGVEGIVSDELAGLNWGIVICCVVAIICDFVTYYAYSAVKNIKKQLNQQQPQGHGTPSAGPGYPNPGCAPGQPGSHGGSAPAPTAPEHPMAQSAPAAPGSNAHQSGYALYGVPSPGYPPAPGGYPDYSPPVCPVVYGS